MQLCRLFPNGVARVGFVVRYQQFQLPGVRIDGPNRGGIKLEFADDLVLSTEAGGCSGVAAGKRCTREDRSSTRLSFLLRIAKLSWSFTARSFAVARSVRMLPEMATARKLATEKGTINAASQMATVK